MAQNGGKSQVRKKVAVIGAGMTGLGALRHFTADPNYDVVAFERSNTIAGIWNYPEGCEEHVNQPETSPYYCRTYRDLRTNSPRELSCYPDFPFADTVKDTYCTRETVLHYFHAYANHFRLFPHIKFRHQVKLVTPIGGCQAEGPVRWIVEVLDLESQTVSREEYDSVVVCSGHYHKPYLPEINGLQTFQGQVMHSCDYRVPEKFKGKNVLMIGAKVSGNDIAVEIAPFANQVIVQRRMKMNVLEKHYPNVKETTDVMDFGADHLVMRDGTTTPVDVVMLATGYVYDYPFFPPDFNLSVSRGRVSPLYRHLVHCQYNTLAFVGLANMAVFIFIADYQIRYFKALLDGKAVLPSDKEDLLKEDELDYAERLAKGMPEHFAHEMLAHQWEYLNKLSADAGLEPLRPVIRKMFEANVMGIRSDGPAGFRKFRLEMVDHENCIREPLPQLNGH